MRSHSGRSSVVRAPNSLCTVTITAHCSPRSMGPTVRSRSSACARPRTSGKGQSAAPSTTSTRSSGIARAEVRGFGSRCESVATIPTRVDSAPRESGNSSLEADSHAGGLPAASGRRGLPTASGRSPRSARRFASRREDFRNEFEIRWPVDVDSRFRERERHGADLATDRAGCAFEGFFEAE